LEETRANLKPEINELQKEKEELKEELEAILQGKELKEKLIFKEELIQQPSPEENKPLKGFAASKTKEFFSPPEKLMSQKENIQEEVLDEKLKEELENIRREKEKLLEELRNLQQTEAEESSSDEKTSIKEK